MVAICFLSLVDVMRDGFAMPLARASFLRQSDPLRGLLSSDVLLGNKYGDEPTPTASRICIITSILARISLVNRTGTPPFPSCHGRRLS